MKYTNLVLFETLTRMDQKLEHSIASASTENADPDSSDLYSSSKADSDDFNSFDDLHSSIDSSFMESYQKIRFYIPRSTDVDTSMNWFSQLEEDILRVVHRSRIDPNYWTCLSAEEQQKFM